jgi:hypothetical protein
MSGWDGFGTGRDERRKEAGARLSCAEALEHVHHTDCRIECGVHFLIQQHVKIFEAFQSII